MKKHSDYLNVIMELYHKLVAILFATTCFLTTIESGAKSSGKTATKVGLAGIATVGSGSDTLTTFEVGNEVENSRKNMDHKGHKFSSEIARLKHELFVNRHYDKGVRPVKDPRSSVQVTFDFTTRQVLDLNEKNQVLTSLLFSRQFWIDEFLTWDPKDFSNLTSIGIPASLVWRPDITLYEDTGNRDYAATRMPFVEVSYDGRVRYLEPIVIESSCSVNTATFPFDYQICRLSFTPWTHATSKVDLSSTRPQEEMYKDIERFFVSTGEWVLQNVTAEKQSQNWGYVITSKSEGPNLKNTSKLVFNPETNKTEEVFTYYEDTSHIRFYMMPPTATVASVAPDRVTDLHWSEMIFTLHLRRNSSLYMQSMLFPAILLTSIALLGFYLPPDSGERIGLQITILLTYMVFLLTVGEMFPASSGPYLGVYYVTCMGLLGINLGMTVIVLHIHYMPMAAVVKDERGPNGEILKKPPPFWIRILVHIAKLNDNENKCLARKKLAPVQNSSFSSDLAYKKGFDITNDLIITNSGSNKSLSESNLPSLLMDEKGKIFKNFKENTLKRKFVKTDKTESFSKNNNNTKFKEELSKRRNENFFFRESVELKKVFVNIGSLAKYLQEANTDLQERNKISEVENEWKAIARTIDSIALKVYIGLLVVCHIAILSVAITDDRGVGMQRH